MEIMESLIGEEEEEARCFICWRRAQLEVPFWRGPRKKGGGNESSSKLLTCQLSVIFLVRKVLGIKTQVLEEILESGESGRSPGEWGVQLCGGCQVVFREALFVHERLMKLQADWEELVGELRELMLGSWEEVGGVEETKVNKRSRGRKGRPKSRKTEKKNDVNQNESVVQQLRRSFVKGWNARDKDLNICKAPTVLYTTRNTHSILDNVPTIQPIQVNITAGTDTQRSLEERTTPIVIKRLVTVTTLNDNGEETEAATSSKTAANIRPVVKQEVVDNLKETTNYLDFNDHENIEGVPSPIGADDYQSNNSDYPPDEENAGPPRQKKDKRFTRSKPNHKENNRKKHQRLLKAQSFENVAFGIAILPLKKENEPMYFCPVSGCTLKFSRKYACRIHVLRYHYNDPLPHHCHLCSGKRFHQETFFRRHMSQYHKGVRCPFDDDLDPDLQSAQANDHEDMEEAPSPTAADDDDWTPDNNLPDNQVLKKNTRERKCRKRLNSDGSGDEDDDQNNDSDYHPEEDDAEPPPPKKKDRRFTRIKPNYKENNRRKYQRVLKAQSFEKVAFGIAIIPLKKENEQTYSCPESSCDLKFYKKYACRIHVLQDHYNDPLPHHCHICSSKRFPSETSFRRHMSRFHNGVRCPFDDDYDPDLHSAEKLRSAVADDQVVKNLIQSGGRNLEDNQSESEPEGEAGVPEEVLKKFENSTTTEYACRHEPCKRKYLNEMLRDGHEKRVHLGIEACFECDRCPKRFIRRGRLLEHMAISHYSNHPSCHHCGARFVDKVLLAGHIGRAHLGDPTPFHCTACPLKFIRRTKMDMHMFRKHGIPLPKHGPKRKVPARNIVVPKIYARSATAKKLGEGESLESVVRKCWVCHTEDGQPLVFDLPEDIKEHIEKFHGEGEKPFKCPVPDCFKEYAKNGRLDYHICNVHNGVITQPTENEFKCSHCDQSFHRSYLLDAHMAQHGISMYMCNFCAKQFRTKKYLEDHQRQAHYQELNIDPWKCKYCGKVMNTAKSLDHHVKMVHTKDTALKCEVEGCDFGTMYASQLKKHMDIRHSNRKNALCPVCSRTFAHQFYLNRHMRVHTGEKPYKCPTCDKLFSDLPTFQRHKEAHLGRVHRCPVEGCGKEYNTRHAWRVHIKQHQSRGLQVEIPKIRYQPEEMDVEVPQKEVESGGEIGKQEGGNEEEGPPTLLEQRGVDGGVREEGNGDSIVEEILATEAPPPLLQNQCVEQAQGNNFYFE